MIGMLEDKFDEKTRWAEIKSKLKIEETEEDG